MSLGIYEFKINNKRITWDVNKNIEEQLNNLDENDKDELIIYLCAIIKNNNKDLK